LDFWTLVLLKLCKSNVLSYYFMEMHFTLYVNDKSRIFYVQRGLKNSNTSIWPDLESKY